MEMMAIWMNMKKTGCSLGKTGQTDRERKIGQGPGPAQRLLTPSLKPKNTLQGTSWRHWLCYPQDTGPGQAAEQKTAGTQRCPEVVRRAQQTLEKEPTEMFQSSPTPASSGPSARSRRGREHMKSAPFITGLK